MKIVVYFLEGGLILVLLFGVLHRLIRDYIGKPTELEAKLVKKKKDTYYKFSKFGKLGSTIKTDYILEYEANGKLYKFKGNSVFYDSAIEGQKVKIIFKGNRLVNFEPI